MDRRCRSSRPLYQMTLLSPRFRDIHWPLQPLRYRLRDIVPMSKLLRYYSPDYLIDLRSQSVRMSRPWMLKYCRSRELQDSFERSDPMNLCLFDHRLMPRYYQLDRLWYSGLPEKCLKGMYTESMRMWIGMHRQKWLTESYWSHSSLRMKHPPMPLIVGCHNQLPCSDLEFHSHSMRPILSLAHLHLHHPLSVNRCHSQVIQ